MINNRLTPLFDTQKKIFSIFVTAGFPKLDSTVQIIETLEQNGVDLIELGIPFSDSIADGATIQRANEIALSNGASLIYTLETLREVRGRGVKIPIILMGSLNPILQFGVEKFCAEAESSGADGLILPDLPLEFYAQNYRKLFEAHNLANIFLVTSQTSEPRLRQIDDVSDSFIYVVSLAGVTGKMLEIDDERRSYLERLQQMNLRSPLMVGFGIENKQHFDELSKYASGAIIGSAFLREIENAGNINQVTIAFTKKFL